MNIYEEIKYESILPPYKQYRNRSMVEAACDWFHDYIHREVVVLPEGYVPKSMYDFGGAEELI